MMAIQVRVRNFQSIEDATISIDGFTVITGSNNGGKSALMRAVRGVFTNAPPGPLVRRGTAHLTVDLDLGDGNTITWVKGWNKPDQKGGTVNRYILNGKELDNVGRGCPEEVLALGIHPIQAGTEKALWPQIADQFTGTLFLVGSPGSVTAEAIADVERVGRLANAMKMAETDQRSVASLLKVRRRDAEALGKEIHLYDSLPMVEDNVQELNTKVQQVLLLQKEHLLVNGLLSSHKATVASLTLLSGVVGVEIPLEPVEALHTRKRLNTLQDLWAKHQALRVRFDSLQGVLGVCVPAPPDEVLRAKTVLNKLRDMHIRMEQNTKAEEALHGVLGVTIPENLEVIYGVRESLRTAQTKLSLLQQAQQKASLAEKNLLVVSEISMGDSNKAIRAQMALSKLQGLLKSLKQAQAAVEKLAKQAHLASEDWEISVQEVQTLLGSLEECPTCGQTTQHTHEDHQ